MFMTMVFSIWPNVYAAQVADAIHAVPAVAAALTARYPTGSIKSIEIADQVLIDAATAKAEVDAYNLEEQRGCYEKFFMNYCLNSVNEQRRLAFKAIRRIEVAANAYKRRDRADERDRALAEQRAKQATEKPRQIRPQMEEDQGNAVREDREKQPSIQHGSVPVAP